MRSKLIILAVGITLLTGFSTAKTISNNIQDKQNNTGAPPAIPGFENPPQDLDNDGLYEDINGDERFNIFDIQAFYKNYQSPVVQWNKKYFDFNQDKSVDVDDVQSLFLKLGPGPTPLPGFEKPPKDLDQDGLYEDLDGDGEFTIFDVQAFYQHYNSNAVQQFQFLYDFNKDGETNLGDVNELFQKL